MKTKLMLVAVMSMALVAATVWAADEAGKASKPQSTCPVMGTPINKKLFVDANGYRIYVCCEGCIGKVKADPAKYIEKIKASGEVPEKLPVKADDANKEVGKTGK